MLELLDHLESCVVVDYVLKWYHIDHGLGLVHFLDEDESVGSPDTQDIETAEEECPHAHEQRYPSFRCDVQLQGL